MTSHGLEPDGLEPDRLARVSSSLATGPDHPAEALCVACARVVGVMGAGVVLMSGGPTVVGAWASDSATEAVEGVEYELGEGPCLEAYRTKAPVTAPDLTGPEEVRWLEFREGARRAGVRSAFGFPLLIETVCIGALNLYHDEVGALGAEQFADAVATAHVTARTVLHWQGDALEGALAWQLQPVPTHRASFHQATGMVSVQAGVSVDDAQALLRAHAFAESRSIDEVAGDVVRGRVRLG